MKIYERRMHRNAIEFRAAGPLQFHGWIGIYSRGQRVAVNSAV